MAQSLPLYWGSPTVSSDYHPNSFVNLMNYSSMEEAVEEIIRLDKDDAAYLEKVMTPFWPYGANFEEFWDSEIKKITDFFSGIFLNNLWIKPVAGYAMAVTNLLL